MNIQLPAFLPDQSANSGALSVANNVYPKVDGYGPIAGFNSFTDALPAAFAGGASFIASDRTSTLLVGTASGLSKYSSGSWSDLETSMTVTGQWRFAQFGDNAIAVNGSVTKVVDLTAGTSADLTDAPAGVCIAVVGDYVVIGQDSSDLLGIYTSGFNDHTDWDYVSSTATYQPMLSGGEVMGLAGGEYGVILQRSRIMRMTRTGDVTAPFQYDQITDNVGCASKGSVAQSGRSVFFLSDRGFMALDDGQALRPIGSEKVDRTFSSEVSRDEWEAISCAVDPQSKVVIWCVPSGKQWIYNFELDRWTTATLDIEGVFAGFTSSVTLEELAVTYTDLDAMSISLDDPRWTGGNPRLYCVNGDEVGTFFGSTLEATFEFSFMEPVKGRVTRARSVRPITDATDGNGFTMDFRARLGDAPNIVSAGDIRTNGDMPIRGSGRFIKPAWTIAAGTSWSYAQGFDLEADAGGGR